MLLLGLVAAACLPSAPASAASSPAASPYPAGAQRPAKIARRL